MTVKAPAEVTVSGPNLNAARRIGLRSGFDPVPGFLQRRFFTDEEILEAEMKPTFSRVRNFMWREIQNPDAGDYFMNWIGRRNDLLRRIDGRFSSQGITAISSRLSFCP